MKKIHIVIPDLFLPQQLAAYACKDLHVPALQKLLARAQEMPSSADTLEAWLCAQFAVEGMALAPLTLQADGLAAGGAYWLRADPVAISTQRGQMVLQNNLVLQQSEAAQLCASLNAHFAAEGMQFVSPHPQRWYLQLQQAPQMQTHPLSRVVGADMHAHLPYGEDALHWHSVFNEIQMLFYEHAVNQAREQRGELAVSGLWLWGGGMLAQHVRSDFGAVAGNSELASALAKAAGLHLYDTAREMLAPTAQSRQLLVWESPRNALQAANLAQWRNALQQLETEFVAPLLAALAAGQLQQLTLEVLSEGGSRRFVLQRAALWKIWRRPRSLLHYAMQPVDD